MGKMKSGFIRGIWGIYDKGNKLGKMYSRRIKIDNDILLTKLNPYSPVSKVYVFGEDNYKKIIDDGWDATLIDKKPICWDMEKEQYRHKIEIWKYGLMDFDEVVFLDWDCIACSVVPQNFWQVMEEGEKIKAPLFMYKQRLAPSRSPDSRKLSHAAFVYLRGKEVVDEIIKCWEENGRPMKEEIALTLYIDNIGGGWKGIEYYKNKYEPQFITLFPYYGSDYIKNISIKNNIFFHLNCYSVAFLLGDKNKNGIKNRLDTIYKAEIFNLNKRVL